MYLRVSVCLRVSVFIELYWYKISETFHLSANGLHLFFFFIMSVVDVKVRNDYGRH